MSMLNEGIDPYWDLPEESPDESKWNPDDPALTKPGPHEVGGIIRAHQNGFSANAQRKMLGLKGTEFIRQMQKQVDDKKAAEMAGLPIHEPDFPANH